MSSTATLAPSDLTEDGILERAGAWARLQQRAGAQLLVLAYEWAVAHPAERLDPQQAGRPGREGATLIGGQGTPQVTEFAAAEFGARIGRTSHAGRKVMAAALDLRLRLPRLWQRVQALEVRDSYAIHVAERTRDLTAAQAAWVDEEVVEAADGRTPGPTSRPSCWARSPPQHRRSRRRRSVAPPRPPTPGHSSRGLVTRHPAWPPS